MATYCSFVYMFLTVYFFSNCLSLKSCPCVDVCTELYAKNNSSITLYTSCRRGCRFYTLLEFNRKENTRELCISECHKVYSSNQSQQACEVGCQHQKRHQLSRGNMDPNDGMVVEFLYPMLQMHQIYNKIFDQMWQQFHLQWSVFVRHDSGQTIVMKSSPQIIVQYSEIELPNDKTPQNPESNLKRVDLSATPDVKNLQVRAVDTGASRFTHKDPQTFYSDWLDCLSKKTGMPHVIIISMIFLCVTIMLWLCLLATSRSSTTSQKLSISSDDECDNVKTDLKKLLTTDGFENHDIPFKITVQKV